LSRVSAISARRFPSFVPVIHVLSGTVLGGTRRLSAPDIRQRPTRAYPRPDEPRVSGPQRPRGQSPVVSASRFCELPPLLAGSRSR
jgi:hypothetical protein